MGALSIWHWLIVLAVVVVLFGGSGKISRLMADVAKGINAFKKGLEEGESAPKAAASLSSETHEKPASSAGESAVLHKDAEKMHSSH